MRELYTKLQDFGKVKTNEPLSRHTTFKIGGPADFFVTITSTDKVVECLQYLDGEGIDYFMLGGGSNMLVHDEGFRGVVISVKTAEKKVEGTQVVADAGCITADIAQFAMQHKLTGFEWGVGVPGTIGGAVRGNAGAMGSTMKDNVEKISIYHSGEVIEYTLDECEFGYRTSSIKTKGGVVLQVWLALEPTEDTTLMKKALEYLNYRNTTQPKGFASTGCIFKNADAEEYKEALLKHFDKDNEKIKQFIDVGKISAGWLVQEAGMKGQIVGDAQVSEIHGNFIINLGESSAQDVNTLIDQVKQAVHNAFGINLEEEIQIIS